MKRISMIFVILFLIVLNSISIYSQSASLPFNDDFASGAKSNWYINGSHWSFSSGVAVCNIPTVYTVEYMEVGDNNWTNYTFDVDVEGTSGVNKTVGLRFQDINNYLQLHLIGDGSSQYHDIFFDKIVGGQVTNLFHNSNYTILNNTNYHIKAVMNGDEYKVYINNNLELDITDTSFANGGIALINSSGGYAPNNLIFDNVSVNYLLPVVSTNSATDVISNSAKLQGTVNPKGSNATVQFEYGTTTSYGSTITATQSPVSGNYNLNVNGEIADLNANTTYHFRIKATNSSGTVYGSDFTLKTYPNTPLPFNDDFASGAKSNWYINGFIGPFLVV